jgi:cytidylate kinase
MPLIVMNREMGSLGKDVAVGLEQALGVRTHHHEIIDKLANRARIRKSHVVSFLEGSQGLLERLTTDQISLRVLTADEILTIADSGDPILLRGWGASALLKEIPHATRVCVTASREVRVRRMMDRLGSDDPGEVGRIVDENDEAACAVMRRHFQADPRNLNEYDMGFNTDRMSVSQCVDEIVKLSRSAQFAETDESRKRLHDLAIAQHVRAAMRSNAATSDCNVRVTCEAGHVKLEGIVERIAQGASCVEVAKSVTGVVEVENRLQVAELPARLRGDT